MAALWQKMLFWKKPMTKYKEGKDFKFIDFNDTDITGIGILTGVYEGVVYHYTGARVAPENSEIPRLEFGYTIVYSGTHDIDVLTKDDKFHIMMGDILTEIIISQQNEQTRTDNPEEPDLQ